MTYLSQTDTGEIVDVRAVFRVGEFYGLSRGITYGVAFGLSLGSGEDLTNNLIEREKLTQQLSQLGHEMPVWVHELTQWPSKAFLTLRVDDLLARPIEQRVIAAELDSLYTFESEYERAEVVGFVLVHDLIQPILEAHAALRRVFGEGVSMFLQLHSDPEEDFKGLFILVQTNLSDDEALDLLGRFDDEYWLDVDSSVAELLGVDVEDVDSTGATRT